MDAVLASLTTEQIDEWIAADYLDQLLGHEKLYQILALIGSTIVNSWGGNTEPKNFIPRSPADLRWRRVDDDVDSQQVSPNQMAALFAISAPAMGLA